MKLSLGGVEEAQYFHGKQDQGQWDITTVQKKRRVVGMVALVMGVTAAEEPSEALRARVTLPL